MPIDEEPSGPVTGPIPGPHIDKDAKQRFNVDEALATDPVAKQKRREVKDLENAFDPEFELDEVPDAWNWD